MRSLLARCFHLGFENKVILDFLKHKHGICIRLTTLKRRLRDYGLRRKGVEIEGQKLREIVKNKEDLPFFRKRPPALNALISL